MKKVANKLNLNQEASEDAIVSEIESIQNSLKTKDDAIAAHLSTIQNKSSELEKKCQELDEAKAAFKKLEDEVKEMKQKAQNDADDAKAKAEAETSMKAKNLIEGFVAEGRIKNDAAVINKWTEMAKNNLENVKDMIEGLPVNKKAEKITTTNVSDAASKISVVRNTMATKLAKFQGVKI